MEVHFSVPSFHTQLCSIMEILTRAAVAQISKLLEENCAGLRVEVDRLRKELRQKEVELRGAQSHTNTSHILDDYVERNVSRPLPKVEVEEKRDVGDWLADDGLEFEVKAEHDDVVESCEEGGFADFAYSEGETSCVPLGADGDRQACLGAAGRKKCYVCPHCGKRLAYLSCYTVHVRTHTGEKPYTCLLCGRSFTQQSNLTKHQSVHSGAKPYQCAQCGKSFRHRYSLVLHQRTHSGERPFHCAQCGKSFSQSCHYKRHQRCHGPQADAL